jgi:hypothetical protein
MSLPDAISVPIEGKLLPPGFEMLEPYALEWALATQSERELKRRASTAGQLTAFYEAMMPQIRAILTEVDAYSIGALPEAHGRLFCMAFSLNEIAHNVERYDGDNLVISDFDEARFIAAHADHPTWAGPKRL